MKIGLYFKISEFMAETAFCQNHIDHLCAKYLSQPWGFGIDTSGEISALTDLSLWVGVGQIIRLQEYEMSWVMNESKEGL